MNIGDTVFVWWYGKPVQGMIVENKEITPMLSSMVVVRIPIQGVTASALFMPKNVFASEEQILFKHKVQRAAEANSQFETRAMAPAAVVHPDVGPSCSEFVSNTILQQAKTNLDMFKETHWDHEHNHIQISALNEFYDLWVAYMCARTGAMKPVKGLKRMEMEAPATPKEAIQPVKRIVSDKKMTELKGKLKATLKPKKQPEVIQLSLFD